MHFPPDLVVVSAFAVALAGALGGLWMSSLPFRARMIVPFSGGLLVGAALLGLLPEIAAEIGWWKGLPVFSAGYLLLLGLHRKLHVSGGDGEGDPTLAFPGLTIPLLLAAAVHAFLDGWGLITVRSVGLAAIQVTFPVAVMLHKAPEGFALGGLFRASSKTRWGAFGLCALAELGTLAGGWAGASLTAGLGAGWTTYPLAIAGGCFLYLGVHAVSEPGNFSRARTAWTPALAGFAGAALVQQGVRLFRI